MFNRTKDEASVESDQPKSSAIEITQAEVRCYVHGERPDGVKSITLMPTEPGSVAPRLGEELTMTFRVTAIEREERA